MRRDEGYLTDIWQACRRVQRYAAGVTEDRFLGDELLQDGLIRQVQIIGEAARALSAECRDAHPEISWRQIIGMRHRLVHHYFAVNLQVLWEVVQNDVPALEQLLEPLMPPEVRHPDTPPSVP